MKRIELFFALLRVVGDAAVAVAVFLVLNPFTPINLIAMLALAVILVAATASTGLYNLYASFSLSRLVAKVILAASTAAVLWSLFTAIDLIKTWLALILILTAWRIVLNGLSMAFESSQGQRRRALIIGAGKLAEQFLERIKKQSMLNYRFVGILDNSVSKGKRLADIEILGKINQLEEILESQSIDEIIQTSDIEQVVNLIAYAKKYKFTYRVLPELLGLKAQQVAVRFFYDQPTIVFSPSPLQGWWLIGKRIFDIFAAALAGVVLSPILIILIVAAASVYRTFRVFVKEVRIDGRNGRKFWFLRLRSAPVGAIESPPKSMPYEELSSWVYERKNFAKSGKFGRFLRRSGLTELPQLWNVLTGTMTLVGPRPPYPFELAQYAKHHHERLIVKPGMISLASAVRQSESFDEVYTLDRGYAANWSFWLDIKIIGLAILRLLQYDRYNSSRRRSNQVVALE